MKFIPLDGSKPWLNPQNKDRYNPLKCIYCTAGLNYIVVKQDGNIYRCFNDQKSICNIENFNLLNTLTPCSAGYICDPSGDQMFTTQWNENFIKINEYKNNPIACNWKDDYNNIDSNSIYVIITPTNACNFKCPYCCNYYPVDNESRPLKNDELFYNKWINFMDLLRKKYKSIQFQFIGGEPLMYPDIDKLIEHANYLDFDSSMVSNMSSEKQLNKINNINFKNRSKFEISCSLHPLNKNFNFNLILEYILTFKRKGHKIRATIVSWPENIPFYKEWKSIFKFLDIPFWLKGCGGYKDNPKFTGELLTYLYFENSHLTTAEYLESIGWNKN